MANETFLDINRLIFLAVVFFSEDDIGITDYDDHRTVMNKLDAKNHPVLKWIKNVVCQFPDIEEMVEEHLIKDSPPRSQVECSKRLENLLKEIEKKHRYKTKEAIANIKKKLNKWLKVIYLYDQLIRKLVNQQGQF